MYIEMLFCVDMGADVGVHVGVRVLFSKRFLYIEIIKLKSSCR